MAEGKEKLEQNKEKTLAEIILEAQKNNNMQCELMLAILQENRKESPQNKIIRTAIVSLAVIIVFALTVTFGYLIIDSHNAREIMQSQKDIRDALDNIEITVNAEAFASNTEDTVKVEGFKTDD